MRARRSLDQISMSQIKIEIYLAVFEFLLKHYLMTRRRSQTCYNHISVLQKIENWYCYRIFIKLRFWNQ